MIDLWTLGHSANPLPWGWQLAALIILVILVWAAALVVEWAERRKRDKKVDIPPDL